VFRDAGEGVTVSHRTELRLWTALAWWAGSQVTVRTEGRLTLPLRAGQTVETESRVWTALTGSYRGHRSVPALVHLTLNILAVTGTEQTTGAAPPFRSGRH